MGINEIIETQNQDSTGYDGYYTAGISNLLTIPGVKIMRLDVDETSTAFVNAYLGNPDYDAFVSHVNVGNKYRIVLSPERSELFQGYLSISTYDKDGDWDNLFSNYGSSMYVNGTVYSDIFVADATGDRYFTLEINQSSYVGTFKIEKYSISLVLIDSAPVINSNGGKGEAVIDIFENTTAVTQVLATDPDTPISLTYSISGSDNDLFVINAKTGILKLKNPLDFEDPIRNTRSYEVVVIATSNGLSNQQIITVNILDSEVGVSIIGNAKNNTISMYETVFGQFKVTDENDFIQGLGGNDTIYANNGDDTLDGGTGRDTLYGQLGDDVYEIDNVYDVTSEDEDEGIDTVQSSVSHTLGANLENLTLTGSGAINGTGNSLNNVITGNSGNNTLNGGTGKDTLIGGTGNDTYVTDSGDTITEGANSGTDIVRSSVTHTLGANLENLTLTGSAAINGTGNSLNNVITGNSGKNTLNGGTGTDTITGGSGSDLLYGGADSVRDVFIFNSIAESKTGSTRDKVYDFRTKVDDLDLRGIDANTTLTGDQKFSFSTTTAKANSVWYKTANLDGNTKTKEIIVYGDVNGDAKADFEIGLMGVSSITATDFLL